MIKGRNADIIFFDFDKTLADLQDAGLDEWKVKNSLWLRTEFEIESSLTPVLSEIDRIRSINPKAALGLLEKLDNYELDCEVRALPGAEEILSVLKKETKILVTSNGRPAIDKALNQFQWEKYFDVVITRNDTIKQKPDADALLKGVETLNLHPAEIAYFIMVGDSWKDLMAAASFAKLTTGSFSFYKPEHFLNRRP